MQTVFTSFKTIPYDFLEISRGTVYGNRIVASKDGLTGVFKLRSNSSTSNNIELYNSSATLHTRPEDYKGILFADLVGQGVRVGGVTYSITNVTEGKNFNNGVTEHLTFTLERAEFNG